jgi:hypothetical protein
LSQIGAGLQYQGFSTFNKSSSSTWMLTGTGSQHWNILAGTLELGVGGTSGSLTNSVSDNGTFAVNRSDTYSYGFAITGSGGFLQAGTGTTVFTTAETYSGGSKIQVGTFELGGGGSVLGNVTFTDGGAGATFRLDTSTSQIGGNIVGFTGSDHIDLKFLAFSAALTASWVENAANTGGTLSIKNGTTTLASLRLSGIYTSANFNLSADAFGGTLITDPPAPGSAVRLPNWCRPWRPSRRAAAAQSWAAAGRRHRTRVRLRHWPLPRSGTPEAHDPQGGLSAPFAVLATPSSSRGAP